MTRHPYHEQFEPPVHAVEASRPETPIADLALASIAISMKRIADRLDANTAEDRRAGDSFRHVRA